MLVATQCQLLLMDNWQCVRTYEDKNTSINLLLKGYLAPLPGFDVDTFPFVAYSGCTGISLVNLSESYMEQLVKYEPTCTLGQQAFFFKNEEYGMSLHFTTGSKKLENGNIRLNWVRMGFKKDFSDVLSLYGKLPHSDTFGIMDGE